MRCAQGGRLQGNGDSVEKYGDHDHHIKKLALHGGKKVTYVETLHISLRALGYGVHIISEQVETLTATTLNTNAWNSASHLLDCWLPSGSADVLEVDSEVSCVAVIPQAAWLHTITATATVLVFVSWLEMQSQNYYCISTGKAIYMCIIYAALH